MAPSAVSASSAHRSTNRPRAVQNVSVSLSRATSTPRARSSRRRLRAGMAASRTTGARTFKGSQPHARQPAALAATRMPEPASIVNCGTSAPAHAARSSWKRPRFGRSVCGHMGLVGLAQIENHHVHLLNVKGSPAPLERRAKVALSCSQPLEVVGETRGGCRVPAPDRRFAASWFHVLGAVPLACPAAWQVLPNCRQCSTLGDSQGGGEGGFGRRPESHSGALCCSTYCLITDSGAPPHEMMQYDRDQNVGLL